MVRCDSSPGVSPQPSAPIPPAFTPDASDAISPRSSSTTLRPCWDRKKAVDTPAMPPPIISTSASKCHLVQRVLRTLPVPQQESPRAFQHDLAPRLTVAPPYLTAAVII